MPLLDLFFAMFMFFLFIAWISVVFHVLADVFRNRDVGGFAKVIWMAFVIFFPLIGVFAYLIVHGRAMSERRDADRQRRYDAFADLTAP